MAALGVNVQPSLGINYVTQADPSVAVIISSIDNILGQRTTTQLRVNRNVGININCGFVGNFLRLYDSEGNLLRSSSSAVPDTVNVPLVADALYYLETEATIQTSLIGDPIGQFFFVEDQTASNWFTNGIESVIISSPSLSVSTNNFGQVTFTFVNYNLTQGAFLPLAVAQNALQSGQISVTSSDQTVYANVAFDFVAGEFLGLTLVPLKTTSFTGTIVYNVVGAGVSVQPRMLVANGSV